MRVLAGVVGAVVGLPVLAYLALVAINWNDEPPSADAERLLAMQQDRPALADVDNGYVHLRDLSAGTGASADYRAGRSEGIRALASACEEALACLAALDAHPHALAEWRDSERWLLDRYHNMLATKAWQEPLPDGPEMPLPGYQHAMDAQKLHLLDAWHHARAGDAAAVRDMLERDLVFWREVLASSDLLISKMVAGTATSRSLTLGNLALRELPAELMEAAVPPSWREPMTVPERSLARSLGGEWQWVAGALRGVHVPGAPGAGTGGSAVDRLLRPLFQQQATLNVVAARMVRLGSVSELPYAELGTALEQLTELTGPPSPRFHPYNPLGRLIGAVGSGVGYADYMARAADLEGRRRAALLAATLRGEGVGNEAAATAVGAASLRNPYDDAPLEWDAAAGTVVFTGLEQGERGRHAVLL